MMKDAVTLENFNRMERGLPPLKPKKIVKPEPVPPIVDDQIFFDDLPTDELFEFSARLRHPAVKNEDGVSFLGFDVYFESRGGEIAQGWMGEGEFQKLKMRIQVERPDLLVKIGI